MLQAIVNTQQHAIDSDSYRADCRKELDTNGVLVLQGFLNAETISSIVQDGIDNKQHAFFTNSKHNAYLSPTDDNYDSHHPRNRQVASSKGCITTDQIPNQSALHALYNNEDFKAFLCSVLGEEALHEYADPLSSINLHYASEGQELGWHFDNSSFAITLLVQKPTSGSSFQYVKDVRDADSGEMNFDRVGEILDDKETVQTLEIDAGDLVLFRGRNSIHRVTPTEGDITRMLVVLAYNTQPGIALSESARMTFFGRLG